MIEETDIWFNPDDFAQAAVYTPSGGSRKSIYVVFDEPGVEVYVGDQQVITTDPSALCKTSDVENSAQGDTLKIGSTTYYITKNLPMGDETTRLMLSKDSV